jgi:hypothetical protein
MPNKIGRAMATGALSSDSLPASAAKTWTAPYNQSIWQAPLVPAALALTTGILTDRYASVPLLFSISVILAGLIAWAVTRLGPPTNLGLMYLALASAAFGAAYHHWQRDTIRSTIPFAHLPPRIRLTRCSRSRTSWPRMIGFPFPGERS